jgi:hypothetical protein
MYPFRRELGTLVHDGFISDQRVGKQKHLFRIMATGLSKLDEFETTSFLHQALMGRNPDQLTYTNALLRGIAEKSLLSREKPYAVVMTVEPKGTTAKRVAVLIGLTDEGSSKFLELPEERRKANVGMMQSVLDSSARMESTDMEGLVNFVLGWDPAKGAYIFAGSLSAELSGRIKQLKRKGILESSEDMIHGTIYDVFGRYLNDLVSHLTALGEAEGKKGIPVVMSTLLTQYDPKSKRLTHTQELERQMLKDLIQKMPMDELRNYLLKSVT